MATEIKVTNINGPNEVIVRTIGGEMYLNKEYLLPVKEEVKVFVYGGQYVKIVEGGKE